MKLNFWPFNRNKQESALPEEVQEYYQAEQRERTSVASLLAVGTLVATVVLALGIYFGGRWMYRTLVDDGSKTAETTETAEVQNEQEEAGETDGTKNGAASPELPGGSTQGSSTSQTGTSSTSTTRPSRTPNTGALPNTGPDSDL